MSAENFLFLLDECDELNILVQESLRPAALLPLMLVVLAILIGWQTQSLTLGVCSLVAVTWGALVLAWLADHWRSLTAK